MDGMDAFSTNKLCTIKSMQNGYPKTDIVNLEVRSLDCDSTQAKWVSQEQNKSQSWFDENCVDLKAAKDERPVIYVSDSYQYFNVTKQATFKDVIFDGINSFASFGYYKLGAELDSFSTRYWPRKFCELNATSRQEHLAQQRGNSKITQMIDDVNNEIDVNEKLQRNSYGYVPMSPVGEEYLVNNETG